MKNFKYLITTILLAFFGCNEEKFLKEVPLDVYTSEISYNTPEDIVMTITEMYRYVKYAYNAGFTTNTYMIIGTDVGMSPRNPADQIGYGGGSDINPQSRMIQYMWGYMYQVIKNANLVLEKIELVDYASEDLKNAHIAEARFFRGYAYRTLANMYGSVPIILEVLSSPKRDYVRAESRDAVYQQAASDLEFATNNLPTIENVEASGRVSKAAAYHILSEVYISLREWDKAIAAAAWVIDNPNFRLMTERFGRRTDVPETNVFWDLFQKGNVDWQAGNKETIWALQTVYGIPGGSILHYNYQENFGYEFSFGPLYWFIKDPDGILAILPTTYNGGRTGGAVSPVNHVKYDIWKGNWDNDIRNAPCNIKREFIVDNPASAYFGQSANIAFPQGIDNDSLWHRHPYWMKLTTPGDHPPETIRVPENGLMWGLAGSTYKNWQHIRLAETYLLLAEAYLGKGDKLNAAGAINVVRNRAGANPVDATDVDIDYILDERLRELLFEEPRRMTLMRLGRWYDRTTRYNQWSSPDKVQEHWELFPIPYSEIERNTGAELVQNPGYTN